METRKNIFISYSHQDKDWLERFNVCFKPLIRSAEILIWDDTNILPGANWRNEIKKALNSSKVAVLLVSQHFLASDFINNEELPTVLEASTKEGLVIFWICVSSCLYEETELVHYQAANNPAKPLDSMPSYEQNYVLKDICQKIKIAFSKEEQVKTTITPKINRLKANEIPEIAPDDWSNNPNSIFNKFKKMF